jgi:ribosomal protein S18 acetylase RimI-like enzyme
MLVRALTSDDASSFQSLRLFALQESPASFASTYDDEKDRSRDDITERLTGTDNQTVFGAFEEERLVGIAGVRRDPFRQHRHKAHLWGMYVAPDQRGAGVSKLLMAHAIRFAKHMPGVTQLNLTVAADNAVAFALYRSIGFEELDRESASLFADDARADDILMCLRFTPPR